MTRIGILSDTHGHWDDKLKEFFLGCDEIWHAGDIGNIDIADQISSFKILRAVHGNIDDSKLRISYPEVLRFKVEEVDVMIKHIGGYPGNYEHYTKSVLMKNPPNLLICGHSHILKVLYDKKYNLMYMNPGAAGLSGFHKIRTAIRFEINISKFQNLEILEIKR
jgi:putative phosphoesterase